MHWAGGRVSSRGVSAGGVCWGGGGGSAHNLAATTWWTVTICIVKTFTRCKQNPVYNLDVRSNRTRYK